MPRSASSAVDKALDLVEAVARSDRPRRLVELADEVGMHRATAYRVLVDLVARGWVLRYGDRYLPGTVVLQLSSAAAASSLAALSRPVLDDLARRTEMMTNLQVLESAGSRILDVVRPPKYSLIAEMTGQLLPVHRFAGPLALVAALDDVRAEPYMAMARADGYELDGPGGLRADLADVREQGHAVVRGRSQDVIASVSQVVGARAGLPLCALTVVGLNTEFDDATLARITALLNDAVATLQHALSDPEPGSHDLSEKNGDDND